MYQAVEGLLAYALQNKLIEKEDVSWARNSILALLHLPSPQGKTGYTGKIPDCPSKLLSELSFYMAENNLLTAPTATYREIFETALMSIFTDKPSNVIKTFRDNLTNFGAQKATDEFFKYCSKVYYVKTDRIEKNLCWRAPSDYGDIDITINLSKPEKDPKEIALHGRVSPNENKYPKCLLCVENEGYEGRLDHPARQNLRLIPLKVNGKTWYFQYSPYGYYNEHCILLNENHTPMKITSETFKNLLDFVAQFPHYFIGSNADLPIVGGSILTHDHYQAGHYTFAMERAEPVYNFRMKKYPSVDCAIICWPMSVLRLRGDQYEVGLASAHILKTWQTYDDKSLNIIHASNGEQHNTITPIARFKDGKFEIDLALRNNRTTKEYPWGIFHSRPEKHNIKRENIGLIEVLGLAILPARLKTEMAQISTLIAQGKIEKMKDLASLNNHYNWVKSFIGNYEYKTEEDVYNILLTEIGETFISVLEDCGVFKHDSAGKEGFIRFIKKLGGESK